MISSNIISDVQEYKLQEAETLWDVFIRCVEEMGEKLEFACESPIERD